MASLINQATTSTKCNNLDELEQDYTFRELELAKVDPLVTGIDFLLPNKQRKKELRKYSGK